MNIGDVFGRLVVTGGHFCKDGKKVFQECTCTCGTVKFFRRDQLVKGVSTSCGCYHLEKITKHGRYKTKEYRCWQKLRSRCTNTKDKNYAYYGGRGIKCSPDWDSFDVFFSDMGTAPVGYSLERKDNNGDYSKGNCVWASWTRQARNKRNTTYLTYKGVTRPLHDWADFMGVSAITLRKRLEAGWSSERIIEEKIETKFNSFQKKKEGRNNL